MIPEQDRKILREKGQFLIERGLTKEEDEYSINYYHKDYIISIWYAPYSLYSSAFIQFRKRNEFFDIGWIMTVRTQNEQTDPPKDKLEYALEMLEYIRENYDSLIQYEFCKASDRLIDKYVDEHKAEYLKNEEWFLNSLKEIKKDDTEKRQKDGKEAGRILDKICFWKKEK